MFEEKPTIKASYKCYSLAHSVQSMSVYFRFHSLSPEFYFIKCDELTSFQWVEIIHPPTKNSFFRKVNEHLEQPSNELHSLFILIHSYNLLGTQSTNFSSTETSILIHSSIRCTANSILFFE